MNKLARFRETHGLLRDQLQQLRTEVLGEMEEVEGYFRGLRTMLGGVDALLQKPGTGEEEHATH